MLSLAPSPLAFQRPPMVEPNDDDAELKLLGQALANLRERAKLSQGQAAEAYRSDDGDDARGTTSQNWSKYERGQAPGIFKPEVQRRLTRAVGATPDDLKEERDRIEVETFPATGRSPMSALRPIGQRLLQIRDRVRAGAWLQADDYLDSQPREFPAARDERFPYADQWLSQVAGDSVNKLNIFDGDLVHCINAVSIFYQPKTGDIVEVERKRFDGRERELTLKQVEVTQGGVLLWPRSTNPRWKEPLSLFQGLDGPEEIEVSIRGLVIAVIRSLIA